jgi:hypothetical protein
MANSDEVQRDFLVTKFEVNVENILQDACSAV